MSKFTDRLRVVRYFSDEIMAARMPADEDLIFDMRKDRKDAAAIIDEMETALTRICGLVESARLLGNVEDAGDVCRRSVSFGDFEAGYDALAKLKALS